MYGRERRHSLTQKRRRKCGSWEARECCRKSVGDSSGGGGGGGIYRGLREKNAALELREDRIDRLSKRGKGDRGVKIDTTFSLGGGGIWSSFPVRRERGGRPNRSGTVGRERSHNTTIDKLEKRGKVKRYHLSSITTERIIPLFTDRRQSRNKRHLQTQKGEGERKMGGSYFLDQPLRGGTACGGLVRKKTPILSRTRRNRHLLEESRKRKKLHYITRERGKEEGYQLLGSFIPADPILGKEGGRRGG